MFYGITINLKMASAHLKLTNILKIIEKDISIELIKMR